MVGGSGGGGGRSLVKCSPTFKVGYVGVLIKRGVYFETARNFDAGPF